MEYFGKRKIFRQYLTIFKHFYYLFREKKSKLQIARIYIHIGTRDDRKISVSSIIEKILHK